MKITKRIWRIVLVVLGVIVAVITFGALRNNRLLEKAKELKEEASETYHSTKAEQKLKQENRKTEYEDSKENKESLDERLSKLKDNIKNSTGILILIMFLIFIPQVVTAQEAADNSLPNTYDGMKELYFQTLDKLVEVRQQRDEAVSIAEDYKSEYERIEGLYNDAEESIDELKLKITDLYEIVNKQNEVIMDLSSDSGLGVLGGITLTPTEGLSIKPGVFAGLSFNF